MTTPNGTTPRYEFADLTLDVGQRRVTRQGHPIALGTLNFDLLRVLVESAPNVVTFDDLAEKVWGRHFVSPENVAQRVMLLRQALSEDATRPRYVEAVRAKGYRLICPVQSSSANDEEHERPRPQARRPAVQNALVGLVLVVVAAVVAYWTQFDTATEPAVAARNAIPRSVAVLPLVNLSPEPDKAHVAAGLHEEILNQLAKVRDLNVIAANSVLTYGDDRPSIVEIARTLRVQSVMTGSVRFADGRMRVTVELADGETGTHLWVETYERQFNDIFAIESDIASNIARALTAELSDEQDQLLRRASTQSFEAYELYLAAIGHGRDRSGDARVRTSAALELLNRALKIDPTFVDAWIAKANLHSIRAGLVAGGTDEEQRAAIDAASQAIAIDSGTWQAHRVLSFVLANQGDWLGAEAESRRALELGMSLSQAPGSGVRMEVGDFAGARRMFQENLQIDPMNSIGAGFLLAMHEMVGDSEARRADYERGELLYGDWLGDAIELLLRLGDRDAEFLRRQDFSVDTDYVSGSDREIHRTGQLHLDAPEIGLEALRSLFADESYGSAGALTRLAAWAAYFDDPELALRAMSKAIREQPSRVWYLWLPIFEDTRAQPELKTLIRELNLVEYWRQYGWPSFCRPTADDFECH